MPRELELGVLDVGWVKKFRDRISTTRGVLKAIGEVANTAAVVAEMSRFLQEDSRVQVNTSVDLKLKAVIDLPTGKTGVDENGNRYDQMEQHTLDIKECSVPAGVFIQVLQALGVYLFETVKSIEEDSTKLQDVLGAVSDLRDLAKMRLRMGANGEPEIVQDPKPEPN